MYKKNFKNIKETLDSYLNYLDENKWSKMVQAGKLGQASINRLTKAGVVKPVDKWLSGINKGTENIIKKTGGKVVNKPDMFYANQQGFSKDVGKNISNVYKSHGTATFGKNRLHVPNSENIPKPQRVILPLVKRHEVDEIRIMNKLAKKYGMSKLAASQQWGGLSKHGHVSDEVLRKEKELTDLGSKLYGRSSGAPQLTRIRRIGGEYENIGTKKEIAKLNAKKIKETDKLMKQQKLDVSKLSPEEKQAYRKQIIRQILSMKGLSHVQKKLTIRKYLMSLGL